MPQLTTAGPVEDVEYLGAWFSVEIAGLTIGAFTDVDGLSIEVTVVDVEDAKKDTASRKTPGVAKYGDITLKRKLTADKTFWTWAKSIRDGATTYRKNGSVVLHNIAGAEIGRWTFTNAWPSKWSGGDLSVDSDDAIDEEITLAIEYLERIS
jgi:phage tail-like protein